MYNVPTLTAEVAGQRDSDQLPGRIGAFLLHGVRDLGRRILRHKCLPVYQLNRG
jgi:hypothetical protein